MIIFNQNELTGNILYGRSIQRNHLLSVNLAKCRIFFFFILENNLVYSEGVGRGSDFDNPSTLAKKLVTKTKITALCKGNGIFYQNNGIEISRSTFTISPKFGIGYFFRQN